MIRVAGCLACCLSLAACSLFGSAAPERSYFVLHGLSSAKTGTPAIDGLLRVRTLDADTIYEKFQIVLRRNPYELQYSDSHVWAVKPNRMVSDMIARSLLDAERFTAVGRELGELRPDYILGGDLHAIEVYDSGDVWFAHLSLSLALSRYSNGETLLNLNFDERRPVPERSFAQAARALSGLLSTAMDELVARLDQLEVTRETSATGVRRTGERRVIGKPAPAADVAPAPDEPMFVPEKGAPPAPK
ncbi:MAG: membrane integrity-associated transporter subunit PqiC [Deltaproteobacteria bacterium]|nr:membrane integrity-associated transporter subunit PqiC [Deltaproteobacteria bacterium]